METQEHENQKRENGFTLIELLIAIVVVGILTAVAIVGIGGLVDNGKTAACQATADAAKAATAVHFANTSSYPSTFAAMATTPSPVELDVPSGITIGTTTLSKGTTWVLTMNNPGLSTINYSCSTTPTT